MKQHQLVQEKRKDQMAMWEEKEEGKESKKSGRGGGGGRGGRKTGKSLKEAFSVKEDENWLKLESRTDNVL